MAATQKGDANTSTYGPSNDDDVPLRMFANVAHVMLDNKLVYTQITGVPYYESDPIGLIDHIKFGNGSRWPIHIKGRDLNIVCNLMNDVPSEFDGVNDADGTRYSVLRVPVGFNVADFPEAYMHIKWGTAAFLGTGYTITSSQLFSTIVHEADTVSALRVEFNQQIKRSQVGGIIKIKASGKLKYILMIARDVAGDEQNIETLYNAIDTVTADIEGFKIQEMQGRRMQMQYVIESHNQGGTRAGVYLMKFPGLPIVGNNSELEVNFLATVDKDVDVHTYLIYEPSGAPSLPSEVTQEALNQEEGNRSSPTGAKPSWPLGGAAQSAIRRISAIRGSPSPSRVRRGLA